MHVCRVPPTMPTLTGNAENPGVTWTYEGDVKDGMKHGYGAWVSSSGFTFEGEHVHDKRHGFGMLQADSDCIRWRIDMHKEK